MENFQSYAGKSSDTEALQSRREMHGFLIHCYIFLSNLNYLFYTLYTYIHIMNVLTSTSSS